LDTNQAIGFFFLETAATEFIWPNFWIKSFRSSCAEDNLYFRQG
jgi:hypothetical protein